MAVVVVVYMLCMFYVSYMLCMVNMSYMLHMFVHGVHVVHVVLTCSVGASGSEPIARAAARGRGRRAGGSGGLFGGGGGGRFLRGGLGGLGADWGVVGARSPQRGRIALEARVGVERLVRRRG